VLVDRDDVDPFLAHGLEHGLQLVLSHREISIDDGFLVTSREGSSGVHAHFLADRRVLH
jgi:hypothetical protein